MNNSLIKYIIILFIYFLINLIFITDVFAEDSPKETGGGSVVIDKNFDVRTKSTVTAESINAKFAGGVYEGKGAYIIELAEKKGINAGFMASIIGQETGWGKAGTLVKLHYNPGGLTCGNKTGQGGSNDEGVTWTCAYVKDRYYKKFSTPEDGLIEKANYLKRKYIDQGVYTIDKIQKIYCPDGDGNCSTTWTSGILKHMKTLNELGGNVIIESDGKVSTPEELKAEGIYENVSIFKDYEIGLTDIGNVGVNDKKGYDTDYKKYKLGRYIKGVLSFTHTVVLGLSILLFGYVCIIWLMVLLARTRIELLYNWVLKLTANKIDAYDSIAYLCKVTVVVTVFVVISASGLMTFIFAFIYQLFMWIFGYML